MYDEITTAVMDVGFPLAVLIYVDLLRKVIKDNTKAIVRLESYIIRAIEKRQYNA